MNAQKIIFFLLLFENLAWGSEVNGHWQSSCLEPPQKTIRTMVFETQYLTSITRVFADPECLKLAKSFTTEVIYQYKLGRAPIFGHPQKIDVYVKKIGLTFHDSSTIEELNKGNYCGGGWKAGVTKEVSNSICGDGIEINPGDHRYSILKVTNGKLFLADFTDATRQERPTTLKDVPALNRN